MRKSITPETPITIYILNQDRPHQMRYFAGDPLSYSLPEPAYIHSLGITEYIQD